MAYAFNRFYRERRSCTMPEYYIGIDLGTTNTTCAVLRRGSIETLPVEGEPICPSVVSFEGPNKYVVGRSAKRRMMLDPEHTIVSVKRMMGKLKFRYSQHSKEYTPAQISSFDAVPIARIVIDGFLAADYDEVYLAYTDFINTLTQEPTVRLLLPIRPGQVESKVMSEYLAGPGTMSKMDFIYEPDPGTLLDTLLPRFTELQVYQALLESQASEHSARMVAMRNATENANELIDDLTLTYNKARQEAITKEMLDIAGGAEALAQAKS